MTVVAPNPLDQIRCGVRGGVAEMRRVVGRDPADVHGCGLSWNDWADLAIGAVVEAQRPASG